MDRQAPTYTAIFLGFSLSFVLIIERLFCKSERKKLVDLESRFI